VLLLVFATTWVFLLLSTTGLHNDHFMTLAWANQVLGGDVPVRDFTDPGMPLTYLASAAAQLVLGRGIWAEVVLSITLLSAGAALTCYLAARASGSLLVGVLLAFVQVAIAPRLYSAPKIVLHLWAVWAFVRYTDLPTRRRVIGLVACTATAFLVRHDHGLYIWAAATVLLVTAHWPRGARHAVTYGALVALTLVPFFVYVQVNGGLVSYVRSGLSFSRAEYLQGQGAEPPGFDLSPRPPAAPVVTIRWAPAADAAARARVETAHRLENRTLVRERTWRYSLLDTSTTNTRALLSRPEVEDTGGIDRAAARVLGIDAGLFERISRMAGPRGGPWLTTLLKQENALAWMYRLFTWTPLVVLLLVAVTWIWPLKARAVNRPSRPVLTAAAVLGVATNEGFLRDPLDARLADAAAVPLVLVAWLAGEILSAGLAEARHDVPAAKQAGDADSQGFAYARPAVRAIVVTITLVAGAATLLSAAELGNLHKTLEATGATDGPRAVARTALEALRATDGRPPIEGWLAEGDDRRELKELTRYVRECTDPADRLLVTWFAPDVYFYAERRFAAGVAFFQPGFFASPAEEELALARLRTQRVPLVLVNVARDKSFVADHPRLSGHLVERYTLAGEVAAADGSVFRVLADRSAVPVRSVPPWSLPCFR
jgi:hypothetical protein